MALRNAVPLTFRAFSVCDAIDASNAPQGAMSNLVNLVPNPSTKGQYVPRPASTQVTNFSGFTVPGQGEALLVIGSFAYGMIQSAKNAGKSEPFVYNLKTGAFVTISGVTAANSPTSTSNVGDWIPPTMSMIANRLIITHPGYDGATHFVGWIDMRSFVETQNGTTHTSTLIDALTTTLGIQPGDAVSGSGVPANTFVVSVAANSVILSQATTTSVVGTPITFTSGTPAAPSYNAGQTSGQPLAAVPTAVAEFNGRAYYAVNNALQFSDSLVPLQITDAGQALILGDDVPVNALGGLPLSNQVIGGVQQALVAFKQDSGYYQITGDPATTNLASNFVAGSVGTLAPNTVCSTPFGLAYIAPDGLRIVGLDGKSSDPIGAFGEGISVPFLYAVNPTRMCAAYDQNLLRVSVQNGAKNTQPTEEYWYDMTQKLWTGPHSFPAALISAYHTGLNDFLLFANGINAKLWASKTQPSAVATYTENGVQLTITWQTSLLPDNDQNKANCVTETAIGFSLPTTQALTILALDEQGNQLDTVSLSGSGTGSAIWDAFTWGTGVWGGAVSGYEQYRIPWHNNLIFKQMSVQIVGPSTAGLVIGNLYAKYQPLGYMGAHTP